jgi:hypothetical protein
MWPAHQFRKHAGARNHAEANAYFAGEAESARPATGRSLLADSYVARLLLVPAERAVYRKRSRHHAPRCR